MRIGTGVGASAGAESGADVRVGEVDSI
jgi:hypothetical protein